MDTQFSVNIVSVEKRARQRRDHMDHRSLTAKPRVYFFHTGESILENLFARHQRPHLLYRSVLQSVFEQAGVEPAKVYWSQKAGCSCGCSPAFIMQAQPVEPFDIFVDVTIEEIQPALPVEPESSPVEVEAVTVDETVAVTPPKRLHKKKIVVETPVEVGA